MQPAQYGQFGTDSVRKSYLLIIIEKSNKMIKTQIFPIISNKVIQLLYHRKLKDSHFVELLVFLLYNQIYVFKYNIAGNNLFYTAHCVFFYFSFWI